MEDVLDNMLSAEKEEVFKVNEDRARKNWFKMKCRMQIMACFSGYMRVFSVDQIEEKEIEKVENNPWE